MERYKDGLLSDKGVEIIIQSPRGVKIMHAPHIHSLYELYFCPENIPQHSVICGMEYDHAYPTAILSKPYTIHSMSCLEDCKTDYRRYIFYFSEEDVSSIGINFFPEGALDEGSMGILFRLTPSEAEYIENVIVHTLSPEYPLDRREKLLVLSFILNKIYSFTKDGRIHGVGTNSNYVQGVLKYISEHFSEDIDTARLAEIFSVSRSKLDRDFKTAIGATPKTFIESCRLANAKLLLSSDHERKIGDISELCGFTSEQYFYRFFKKHTGKTPAEYKKETILKRGK